MIGKIALYPVILLMACLLYCFAHSIDELKYHNGTQKVVNPRILKWYFRHSKNRNEILTITFIRKLTALVLLFTTTTLFILTFFVDIDGEEGTLLFGVIMIAMTIYLAYLSVVENHYKQKRNKNN